MVQVLTQEQIDERVCVLKRLRELLQQQRTKFQEYLNVLEKQEVSISDEDTNKLTVHTQLEENILRNLQSLQKVIVPMEEMYKRTHQNDSEIPVLKADLSLLQQKVQAQNEINRTKLTSSLASVRTKLNGFNNPYKKAKSVYTKTQSTATMISLEG